LNKNQRKNKIKEIIIKALNIPDTVSKKYSDFLIDTIQKNINISHQSKKINKKSEKQEDTNSDNNKKQDEILQDT
jgi:hypothetical protein